MRIILFISTILLSGSLYAQASDTKQAAEKDPIIEDILETYRVYQKAVIERDGMAAFDVVADKALKYYDHLAGKMLFADSTELASGSILDLILIMKVKMDLPKSQLKQFNGPKMFEYIFNEGLQGGNSLENQDIDNIEYEGRFATATIILDGKPSQFKYAFHLEKDGVWRIDNTTVFEGSEEVILELLAGNNISKTRYIELYARNQRGREIDPEWWQPVLKR